MTRHVVFGTGQVGRLVVEQSPTATRRRREPTRPRRHPRRRLMPGRHRPEFTTRVTAGADVVYFCLNASHYDRWADEFPPLQRGVLAGARGRRRTPRRARQPLPYGPTGGRALVETLPAHPTSSRPPPARR